MANHLYYGNNLDPAHQGAFTHILCRWMVLCTAVAVLVGCTKAKEIYTPDGRQGHTIECSGQMLSWANCFQRASDICGARGYDVFTSAGDQAVSAFGSPAAIGVSTTTTRAMVIACKGP